MLIHAGVWSVYTVRVEVCTLVECVHCWSVECVHWLSVYTVRVEVCTLVECVHCWSVECVHWLSVYTGGVNYFILFNSLYLLTTVLVQRTTLASLDNIRKHLLNALQQLPT